MRSAAFRVAVIAVVASVAMAGCAKKKGPVDVDSNTSASGVGGFGPGSGAGSAPGGFGAGNGAGGAGNGALAGGAGGGINGGPLGAPNPAAPGGFGAGGNNAGAAGQLFRDANGNLVDANGNRVDEFGNPIGAAVAGGGVVGGGAGVSNLFPHGSTGLLTDGQGNFYDANGNPVDQFGNPLNGAIAGGAYQGGGQFAQGGGQFATGPGAGVYNFAGDDGSPGYFAQRVGDRVLFETDSSTIDSQGQEILRRQAAWFNQHPQYAITVEGHADERGTRDYNLALGARRANSVRSFLMSTGMDPNRIRTVSYGKERPVRVGSTPGEWRVNRRAVTTLRGGPSS